MELRQLQYFVAVAKEQHFGRAARKLNVSQPAVSRAIQALETEIGVKLFDRLPRGVRLVEAGRRYLVEVERVLDGLSLATHAARANADREVRELRIGHAFLLAAEKSLDTTLERIAADHPEIQVKLTYMNTFDQQNALVENRIDIGVGHVFGAPLPGLAKERITHIPFCAARITASHPLAGRRSLSLAEFRAEPLLMFRRNLNPPMFDDVTARLRDAGFSGEIVQNAEFSFWNWKVMPRNCGWILANRAGANAAIEGTVCVPLRDVSIPFGIDVVWRETACSPAISAFLEIAGANAGRGSMTSIHERR